MSEKKQLVIGLGEVGQAVKNILRCHGTDKEIVNETYDVLHICFPYSETFVDDVRKYKEHYSSYLVIVHSSVPIGTCDLLEAVHSPIRGVHPHLEEGIRTFLKYFGGFRAPEAALIFEEVGIETQVIRDARTTEALKLWDTTQYGVMIMLEKEIFDFCRLNGLDFEIVYAHANKTYMQGYTKLGMAYVTRPSLMHKPGPVGGHCVLENARLLNTPSAARILKENEGYIPLDQK